MELKDAVYTRQEAATLLKVSLRTFDTLLASKAISPVRFPGKRRLVIPASEIMRFLEENLG